jgi:hypothetical protein
VSIRGSFEHEVSATFRQKFRTPKVWEYQEKFRTPKIWEYIRCPGSLQPMKLNETVPGLVTLISYGGFCGDATLLVYTLQSMEEMLSLAVNLKCQLQKGTKLDDVFKDAATWPVDPFTGVPRRYDRQRKAFVSPCGILDHPRL